MSETEIDLQQLLRRLTECPPDFLEPPWTVNSGTIHTEALVGDILAHLGAEPLPIIGSESGPPRLSDHTTNYLKTVQICCWLLGDPFFAGRRALVQPVYQWLVKELPALASSVPAGDFVTDPDRREELVRRLLRALGMRPAGETAAQADDRLASLDSIELNRVLLDTKQRRERRNEVIEALRKRAAEEAAAKVTRE